MYPHELPVRSEAVAEAMAAIEGWASLRRGGFLLITGPEGSGKSYLADWLRVQLAADRRAAVCDGNTPDPDLAEWVWFVRERPASALPDDAQEAVILAPEYERKAGVLTEWARARKLQWDPSALERLIALPTRSLTRLRSVAERCAREALLPEPILRETDVLRTLARLGWLPATSGLQENWCPVEDSNL